MSVLFNILVPLVLLSGGHKDHPNRDEPSQEIRRLTEAIEKNPGDAAAYFKRAEAHRSAGQLDKALADYREAIKRDPHRAEAYVAWAVVARQSGHCFLDERIAMLRKAIELRPRNAEAHRELAIVFRFTGRIDQAIAALRQALKLKPNDPHRHDLLGTWLVLAGEGGEAATMFRKALELGRRDPSFEAGEVILHFADLCRAEGRWVDAAAMYEEAIAASRNAAKPQLHSAEAYKGLGLVLLAQGQLEKALDAFEKAVSLAPQDSEAHYNRGIVLGKQGRMKEALDAFSHAIKITPAFTKAYRERAEIHAQLGNQEEADEDAAKAKQLGGDTIRLRGFPPSGPGKQAPDLAEAHYNRGIVLVKQGRLKEALDAFSRAIETNPGLAKAYRERAKVHVRLGNREIADADKSKARQLGDYVPIGRTGGPAHRNFETAVKAFKEALELHKRLREAEDQ